MFAGCIGETPDSTTDDGPSIPTLDPGIDDPELSATGRWTPTFDGEVPAINMVLLNDGRILYWSGVEVNPEDDDTDVVAFTSYPTNGESRILDLSGGTPNITQPDDVWGGAGDLFCSGHTVLHDGRVMTAGGTTWGTVPNPDDPNLVAGIQDARVFDPETSAWNVVDDMLLPRWYPSLLVDELGEALAVGGIEHWEQPTEHWSSWESYDSQGDAWNGVVGTEEEQVLPLYSRTYHVAGGPFKGQYFADTAGALWAPFGEHPLQAHWNFQWVFDRESGTWQNVGPSQYGVRSYPGHAMLQLDPAREYAPEFLMFGGTLQQSGYGVAFSERTDLSTDPPTRVEVPDLETARWHPFATTLVDGTVLAVGGAQYDNVVFLGTPDDGATLETELYDPESNAWTTVAPMTVERTYHSSTLLLPDGRVLVGGHVPDPMIFKPWRDNIQDQIVETRFEIYEPGYLFRGARPIIADAPTDIAYGQSFDVDVVRPSELEGFVLVRPGASTHSYDGTVRHILLETVMDDGFNVTVQAPPDGIVAPPGDYMLFALSSHEDGAIPSESVWVHID